MEKETMQSTWEKFQKELKTQTREELHLAIIEDFSNVIAKHLPNFDNNISADTWKLLELFTEETIYQLEKDKICLACRSSHNLLTEETRKSERAQGWDGVDFYPQICSDCWELEKINR
jgi:hypothetical protein